MQICIILIPFQIINCQNVSCFWKYQLKITNESEKKQKAIVATFTSLWFFFLFGLRFQNVLSTIVFTFKKRQIQICSLYMFRQTANYCFIGTQIFNIFPNRKYHKLQQYDNILWIEYNENCTCIHKAIIINYFAMETQFNHLLAFHSLCGLVHFKMVYYLNIVDSFY